MAKAAIRANALIRLGSRLVEGMARMVPEIRLRRNVLNLPSWRQAERHGRRNSLVHGRCGKCRHGRKPTGVLAPDRAITPPRMSCPEEANEVKARGWERRRRSPRR